MYKTHILYTIDNLLIGGAQELVKTLAKHLNKEKFKVSVCSLMHYQGKTSDEPLTREIEDSGVNVFNLHMKSFRDKPEIEKFKCILKNEKIDIAHAHLRPADLWSALIAKDSGVPIVVYSKHETYRNKSIITRLRDAVIFNMYTDCAVALSSATKKHMTDYEFISSSKIKIIHNPVDVRKFTPNITRRNEIRRNLGIPSESIVVGQVARFIERKGINYFIDTCAKVKKQIPNSKFLLVGWGKDEPKYRKMVKDMNLDDSFIFAVAQRNIPELLDTMDIFLFTPIWGESLSIALLEAMAAGKAIVATNIISNPELIENGISGLLPTPQHWAMSVNSLDTQALSEDVIKLAKDSAMRQKFGEQARKKAVTGFSTDVVVEELEALYVDLLVKKFGNVRAKELGFS